MQAFFGKLFSRIGKQKHLDTLKYGVFDLRVYQISEMSYILRFVC